MLEEHNQNPLKEPGIKVQNLDDHHSANIELQSQNSIYQPVVQEEDKEISETDDENKREWKLRRLNSILKRKRALDVDKDNLNIENDYFATHVENM